MVVSLTPIQRVCRQEQFVLAAFHSSPVLLRVRRDRRGSRYDVGSWAAGREIAGAVPQIIQSGRQSIRMRHKDEAPKPSVVRTICTRANSVGVEVRSERRCSVLNHVGALPPIPIGACRSFVSSATPLPRATSKERGGLAVVVVDVGGAIVVVCRRKGRRFWCSGHGAGAYRRWRRPSRCGGVHRFIKRGSLTGALSAPRHVRERGGVLQHHSAGARPHAQQIYSQTAARVQTRRCPCAYAID